MGEDAGPGLAGPGRNPGSPRTTSSGLILLVVFPGAVGLFYQLNGGIGLKFLTRFLTRPGRRRLSDKRLASWLSAEHHTRSSTRTSGQLMTHLRQRGLADGPAAAAAELVTLQLVALLTTCGSGSPTWTAHRRRPHRARRRAGVHQPAEVPNRAGDAAGRDRRQRRCPARKPWPQPPRLTLDPSLGQGTARGDVPPRLQPPAIPSRGRLRRRQPRRQRLAQDIYASARSRGARHRHAIRILARAWIRVISALPEPRRPYQPDRHRGLRLVEQRVQQLADEARQPGLITTAPRQLTRSSQAGPRPRTFTTTRRRSIPAQSCRTPPGSRLAAGHRRAPALTPVRPAADCTRNDDVTLTHASGESPFPCTVIHVRFGRGRPHAHPAGIPGPASGPVTYASEPVAGPPDHPVARSPGHDPRRVRSWPRPAQRSTAPVARRRPDPRRLVPTSETSSPTVTQPSGDKPTTQLDMGLSPQQPWRRWHPRRAVRSQPGRTGSWPARRYEDRRLAREVGRGLPAGGPPLEPHHGRRRCCRGYAELVWMFTPAR